MTYDPLPIVLYPDPVLLTRCEPVESITPEIETLAGRMVATVLAHPNCVGLAAPQVGVPVRMIVVRRPNSKRLARMWQHGQGPLVMVNPEVCWRGSLTHTEDEGCLSQPGVSVPVIRHFDTTIKWTPMPKDGKAMLRRMTHFFDFPARVIQHEIDHLDGINIGRSKG